jgi:hypothetical protein
MLAALYTIIYTFLSICFMRLAPQDLPYSRSFLVVLTTLYLLLASMISLWFGNSLQQAFVYNITGIALTYILTFSLLYFTKFIQRSVQTLTAIMGVDIIFHLVTIPLLLLETFLKSINGDTGLVQVLVIILMGWNLTIYAHILRHALSSELLVGFAVTFVYLIVIIMVLQVLLPGL